MRKYNWNEENKAQNDFFAYIFNSPIVCHVCQACAKESIWATRTPIPRAKFRRITEETTRFPQNKRKKIETFIEICKTKQKNGKGKLPSLRTQSLLRNGYLVDFPFCLSFTESYIFSKTPWLTGMCGWCNSCEATWLWQHESMPHIHYNVRKCAKV